MKTCKKCHRVHTSINWCITNENGEYHSYDGRHALQKFDEKDELIRKFWYQNGECYNDFGPCVVTTDLNGKVILESYKGKNTVGSCYFELESEKIESLKSGSSFIKNKKNYVLIRQVNNKNSKYEKVFFALRDGTEKVFIAFVLKLEHA